ncbi:MAG TPA: 4-hydroxyphenylacetate 3-hydroxylase N-terminal domain-containing protein [Candidatus Binataceae bacterium]|nr:4-hydroxyphenylacetate 3-hydroxylase N-terminal domain-containing protein [Candidatus Binataceae bacterium]
MGIRTGRQFLDSLRDDRQIWLEGERVADVTAHPRLGPASRTLAELYDLQHRPESVDQLTWPSPSSGERVGLTFIEPASEQDLVRRRTTVKTWMDWCAGMMGRTPDFMNIHVTGFASAHEYFARGGSQFGRNIRAYYEFARERDLCLTHTLLSPTVDKSKPVQSQPPGVAASIVKETDAGIVISGARSVATLAPFANEIAVFPSTYLQNSEEARPYAFAFCVPVATRGLRFICRPSLTETGGRPGDHPLSARMDEMDCVAVFDQVLVPWERVFTARDVALVNGLFVETGCINQLMHQFAIKNLAKAEFMLGVALNMCEAVNARAENVQNLLAEMINTVELVRAAIRAAEADHVAGPGGTVLPNGEPLWTVRLLFPQLYPRLVEIVQMLGSSNLVMMPSLAEFAGERADDVALYCQGVGVSAEQRVRLFRLAWDVSCSSFAGRQTLYERFFSGDPWRLGIARCQSYRHAASLKQRVWDFIARAGEAGPERGAR